MQNVVLDANALMMPFQFNINLHSELGRLLGDCEFFVPSSVVSELEGLASGNRFAKAGLSLAETFQTYPVRSKGDEAVLEAALALNATVITNDIALLKKLKEKGLRRVRLRSKSHLVLEGE